MYKLAYTERFKKAFNNLYENSINMDIRILWYFENKELIILADIGHHDILKKF